MMIPIHLKENLTQRINDRYVGFMAAHGIECPKMNMERMVYEDHLKVHSSTKCVFCGMQMIIIVWKKK